MSGCGSTSSMTGLAAPASAVRRTSKPRRWPRCIGYRSCRTWSGASSATRTCATSPPDQSTYLLSPWYLHHNFVVAVLNDLFGIQSRGGCSCAGPHGAGLLGIDIDRSHAFEREIARGCEGIKPGWVRVNFNYFISEAVFGYLLAAVH